MPGQTTLDRVIVMAVAALLGAFALSIAGPYVTHAGGADEISGKRDDDLREVEVKDDDDDEGDSANRSRGSNGSRNSGRGDGSKSMLPRVEHDPWNGTVQHKYPRHQHGHLDP